jgi:hypothetical protein
MTGVLATSPHDAAQTAAVNSSGTDTAPRERAAEVSGIIPLHRRQVQLQTFM